MSIRLADVDSITLRFPVGTRVECNCGQWKAGTIVKHFYTQRSFPEGMCVPYQVLLDDKKLIFAPADEDRVVRQLFDEPGIRDEEEEFMEDVPDADKTPVTIITGFLGSALRGLPKCALVSRSQNQPIFLWDAGDVVQRSTRCTTTSIGLGRTD